MQGIVSLLDAASEQAVRALWNELDRDWNLREGVRSAPIPHISYHVAETYDLTRIGHIPRRVAVETPPLRARIIGLDRFTEIEPVLYLAVERSAALLTLHASIWRAVEDAGIARDAWKVYAPTYWVPHLTLAMGDLTEETLKAVRAAWSGRDLKRSLNISAISLFAERSYTPLEQVQLSGTSGVPG